MLSLYSLLLLQLVYSVWHYDLRNVLLHLHIDPEVDILMLIQTCPQTNLALNQDRALRGGRKPRGLRLKRVLEGCGSVTYTCRKDGYVEVANRTATLYDIGSTVPANELGDLETQTEPQYIALPAYGKLEETIIRGPNGATTTKAIFSRGGRPFFIGYEVGSFRVGNGMPWGTYHPTHNWASTRPSTPPRMAIFRVKTVGADEPYPDDCLSRIKKEKFCAQFWVYGKLEDRLEADSPGPEKFIC